MKPFKGSHGSTLVFLILILLLSIVVYFDSWGSMAEIWWNYETYTHGFFVLPASLWLIWQNKSLHSYLYPSQPSLLGLSFVIINGFVWLLAALTQTQVIQHYSLVGMLVGSFWYYLGNAVIRKILFPVAFLFFMVPAGAVFIPYLMEFTADFTIALLRFTGLSVYREGLHFTLVSGKWSVVEACSGLRYLLASFTLGVIYAYISYTKTIKRLLFILFSVVLPIIANGLRAYMIVMIGHLSDMKLAVGVDHLIYGAVFFALIIFFMFYVGSIWKDPLIDSTIVLNDRDNQSYNNQQNFIIALSLVVCLGMWPLISYSLQSGYHAQTDIPQRIVFKNTEEWQEIEAPKWSWRPKFNSGISESLKYFKKQDFIVGLYQVNFGDEREAELVSSKNSLLSGQNRKRWHQVLNTTPVLESIGTEVNHTLIRNNQMNEDFIILRWYQIGRYATNSPYIAKLYQLIKRLTLDTEAETYQVIFASSTHFQQKSTLATLLK